MRIPKRTWGAVRRLPSHAWHPRTVHAELAKEGLHAEKDEDAATSQLTLGYADSDRLATEDADENEEPGYHTHIDWDVDADANVHADDADVHADGNADSDGCADSDYFAD